MPTELEQAESAHRISDLDDYLRHVEMREVRRYPRAFRVVRAIKSPAVRAKAADVAIDIAADKIVSAIARATVGDIF